jgi:hypothetical protein
MDQECSFHYDNIPTIYPVLSEINPILRFILRLPSHIIIIIIIRALHPCVGPWPLFQFLHRIHSR